MTSRVQSRGPLMRAILRMKEDLWLQGVAISTLTVALAIMGVYLTLCFNLHQAAIRLLSGPSLTLVLDERISPDEAAGLAEQLLRMPQIKRSRFVGREEAMERFRAQLGSHANLLDDLTGNPLPNAVELVLSPEYEPGEELMALLGNQAGVTEVVTSRPWLHRLEAAIQAAGDLALALGILLFLGVILVVSNTVRLSVHVRREQLELMALVGASTGYMRRPFLVEAMLQGVAAALVASLLIWLLFNMLAAPASLPLGFSLEQIVSFPALLPLVLAGLAIVAGLIGGFLGVGRTLRQRRPL